MQNNLKQFKQVPQGYNCTREGKVEILNPIG